MREGFKVHLLFWCFALSLLAALFCSATIWLGEPKSVFSGEDMVVAWSYMTDFEHIVFGVWLLCTVGVAVVAMWRTEKAFLDFAVAVIVEMAFFAGYIASQFDVGNITFATQASFPSSALAVMATNIFLAILVINGATVVGFAVRCFSKNKL